MKKKNFHLDTYFFSVHSQRGDTAQERIWEATVAIENLTPWEAESIKWTAMADTMKRNDDGWPFGVEFTSATGLQEPQLLEYHNKAADGRKLVESHEADPGRPDSCPSLCYSTAANILSHGEILRIRREKSEEGFERFAVYLPQRGTHDQFNTAGTFQWESGRIFNRDEILHWMAAVNLSDDPHIKGWTPPSPPGCEYTAEELVKDYNKWEEYIKWLEECPKCLLKSTLYFHSEENHWTLIFEKPFMSDDGKIAVSINEAQASKWLKENNPLAQDWNMHCIQLLAELNPCHHSPGFTNVTWRGIPYLFTPNQAKCVKMLWGAMKNGTPEIHQQEIFTQIENDDTEPPNQPETLKIDEKRIVDVFKDHPALGTMIVSMKKGFYRLNTEPPTENRPQDSK